MIQLIPQSICLIALSLLVQSSVADYSFLAVGDWGGKDASPYYTAGQLASVTGMDKIAQALDAQFVVALGDNFYSSGIRSNENDARFKNTFESIYAKDSLQVDWYVIAGNHDWGGNVTAQVEYSKHSSRWKFPDFYHSKSFTAPDGTTLDIVLIDTVNQAVNLATTKIKVEGEEGYFDPLPEMPKTFASAQWTWIEDQMKASTADYLLVGGHYPVYSVCEHGPFATLVSNLKPLLEKYSGHYMAGHDHCQEHIQETGSKVNYFLTGTGEECCYSNSNLNKNPTGSVKWYIASNNAPKAFIGGFASFSISQSGLVVKYYDQDGNVQYTAPTVAKRS